MEREVKKFINGTGSQLTGISVLGMKKSDAEWKHTNEEYFWRKYFLGKRKAGDQRGGLSGVPGAARDAGECPDGGGGRDRPGDKVRVLVPKPGTRQPTHGSGGCDWDGELALFSVWWEDMRHNHRHDVT